MPEKPKFLDPSNPRRVQQTKEVITCSKCGCEWMELVLVQQYPKHHAVILGQEPGPTNDIGFWLFRCPKCSEVYEPRLTSGGPQDLARRGYDKFVDLMTETPKADTDGENV